MLNGWAATTALSERIWRGFWRGVLAVHNFSFWAWVRRQAYPDAFFSSSRYNRFVESGDSGANAVDRYSR